MLSLAIGAQGAGMLAFGEVGEIMDPGDTVLVFAAIGFVSQLAFNIALPACRRTLGPGTETSAATPTEKP